MGTFSLAKSERLLRRADFKKLSEGGNSIETDYFVILYGHNGLGTFRLGVTVGKRVGCAVMRNRVKRLVREHFRLRKALFRGSYDVNVIAKGGTSDLSPREIRGALEDIVRDMLRDCKHEAVSAGTH